MDAPFPLPEKPTGGQVKEDDRDRSSIVVETLKKFAKGLCSSMADPKGSFDFSLQSLFSSDLEDDAVVLTIPSLDLKMEHAKKQDVLPTLGEHAMQQENASDGKPDMEASVFSKAEESPKEIEDQKAVEAISRKISWTKSTLPYASSAVCVNLSNSFKTLLNSRLRSWTLLLLKHSLSTGSSESRSQLLGMLSAKIDIISAEVTFKTLPPPNIAQGIKPKDSDVMLPLLFEASVKISIQEQQERVVLRAPGTIAAISGDHGLKLVNVKLDGKMMMKKMVDQSRLVVLRAVSTATCTSPEVVKEKVMKKPEDVNDFPLPQKRPPSKGSLVSLSGTKSMLNVVQSPQDRKAMTSALRLDNILQGKTQTVPFFSAKLRAAIEEDKSKRKTGPTLGALAPEPKKSRIAQSVAKLKSFKSFGRPHAGDLGSGPNNATFGEFGSGHSGIWGRDGRLAAHPQPIRVGLSTEQNATFGESTMKSAAQMGAAMLGGMTTKSTMSTSSLGLGTRTPTALESSLMKKLAR